MTMSWRKGMWRVEIERRRRRRAKRQGWRKMGIQRTLVFGWCKRCL